MESDVNQEKLEGKLVKSIEAKELSDLAVDYAEVGLDSILDEGIIRDIPILRTLVSIAKAGLNVRDRLYVKKIAYFLQQVGNTTQEQREEFIKKYCQDIKRFEEAVLLILEQADSIEKSSLVGKIFKACILDVITYDDALKLSSMVNRAFWGDLEKFLDNENVEIGEDNQSLVMAGLYVIAKSSSIGNRGRYNFGGVKYEITNYGKKLVEIAKT